MVYWLKELTNHRKCVIIKYMSKLGMRKELSGESVKTWQVLLFALENMVISVAFSRAGRTVGGSQK